MTRHHLMGSCKQPGAERKPALTEKLNHYIPEFVTSDRRLRICRASSWIEGECQILVCCIHSSKPGGKDQCFEQLRKKFKLQHLKFWTGKQLYTLIYLKTHAIIKHFPPCDFVSFFGYVKQALNTGSVYFKSCGTLLWFWYCDPLEEVKWKNRNGNLWTHIILCTPTYPVHTQTQIWQTKGKEIQSLMAANLWGRTHTSRCSGYSSHDNSFNVHTFAAPPEFLCIHIKWLNLV